MTELPRRLLLTGLASAPLLASPLLASRARAAEAAPVRVGVLVDQSGPFADTAGAGSVEAARMAVEDFGPRVLGRPIEVLSADHQNKTDVGVSIAREWLGPRGVDMILDMGNSSIALAVQGLVRDANRVAIPVSAVSSDLTGRACSPNGIQWAQNNWSNAAALMRVLRTQGKSTFFLVTVDYNFGLSLEADAANAITGNGGRVLGRVRHPLNTSDFSSYLLQAQASGAEVVVFASAGTDVINGVEQAHEFGLTPKQTLAAPGFYLSDVHAVGLTRTQGLTFMQSWYWDLNDTTRAWARRFMARRGRMPNDVHAADYSATLHFLRAVAQAGTLDGRAVIAAMKAAPVRDAFTQDGYIRANNKMVFTRYLTQVKTPAESKAPWDYLKVLASVPPDQAFRPLSETGCPLVRA